jgi:rubrerythrin
MDIGSIFLILALLVLVAMFISRPFFERKPVVVAGYTPEQNEQEHELSALLAERDRLLNALQELDFDHVLGKIPEEDYPNQRAVLLQRGAEVLRQLDTYQNEPSSDDVEARIEAVIAARRADAGRAASPQAVRERVEVAAQVAAPDDAIEAMLSNRRRVRHEKAAGFCPQCGGPLQKSDRFCPKCGAAVA